MKKFLYTLCMMIICVFCFTACGAQTTMSNVINRINEATSSVEIKNYFANGIFYANFQTIQDKIADTAQEKILLNKNIDTLNQSMIIFNRFKSQIEGAVMQRDANASQAKQLYNQLESLYYSLKNLNAIKFSIEQNKTFNISNTQDKNEFNTLISRLSDSFYAAQEANITIIDIFQKCITDKVKIETATDSNQIISRTYEAVILKTHLFMLENTSNMFLSKLRDNKVFVYGGTNDSIFESLNEVLVLGNKLKDITSVSFNTIGLDKMKLVISSLKQVETTFYFAKDSINSFTFNGLINNVIKLYNVYSAENLTKYLNNDVSALDKANYNFAIQETQNYLNVIDIINNLF